MIDLTAEKRRRSAALWPKRVLMAAMMLFIALGFEGCAGLGCPDTSPYFLRIANWTDIGTPLDAKAGGEELGTNIEVGEASCFKPVDRTKGGWVEVFKSGQSQPIYRRETADESNFMITTLLWGQEGQIKNESVITERPHAPGKITYRVVFASENAGTYKVFVAKPGEDALSGKTPDSEKKTVEKISRTSGTIECDAGTQIAYLVDSNDNVVAQSEVCPNIGDKVQMIVAFKDNGSGGYLSKFFTQACDGPLRILTTTLASGAVNSPYYASIGASGGAGFGFSFSLDSGTLPNGITLNSTGELSGIPTEGGTFGFTVKVTDGDGGTATQALALTISDPTASTRARFFNAATNASNASLTGSWSGSNLGAAVAYGSMGAYSDILAATADAQAKRSGGTLVGTLNTTIGDNTHTIFVAAGNQATGVPIVKISKASSYLPPGGKVAFRLVNGLSDVANNVDFYLVPKDSPIDGLVPQVSNLAYGTFSLVEIDAGDYDLVCTPSGFNFVMFRTNVAAVAAQVQVVGVAVSPPGVNGSFLLALDN